MQLWTSSRLSENVYFGERGLFTFHTLTTREPASVARGEKQEAYLFYSQGTRGNLR